MMNDFNHEKLKEDMLKSEIDTDLIWGIIMDDVQHAVKTKGVEFLQGLANEQYHQSYNNNLSAGKRFQSLCVYYCLSKAVMDKGNKKIFEKEFGG